MTQVNWRARWEQGRIGFHRDSVNPWLVQYGAEEIARAGARVLVPLCGRTEDLPWLVARGCDAVGVELSETAVAQFFERHGPLARLDPAGPVALHVGPHGSIWRGDFFALRAEQTGLFDAVWDRAALIAVERDRRPAYVEHLRSFLAPGATILLVALRYDTSRMEGPPFAVHDDEVRALFRGADIECLGCADVLDTEPKFKARGLEALDEAVYRIRHVDA